MVSDMSVIKNAAALSCPVTDLADFMMLVVHRNLPYLFMTESECGIRWLNMQRDQINFTI